MDSIDIVLLVILILSVTAFVRSFIGFAQALLAMPLLVMIIGVETAASLVAFVSLTMALVMLMRSWHKVDIRATRRLTLSRIFGIPVGLVLLKALPESLIKDIVGIVLIAFGLYNLMGLQLPTIRRVWPAYLLGFVSGTLQGAYNSGGPPIVVYGELRGWSPERFRATLQSVFLKSTVTLG